MTNIIRNTSNVDIAKFAAQSNAVIGTKGSGKTYTSILIAEILMKAGIPIGALDPVGIWRNIAVPAEHDNGRGFPVVIIGREPSDVQLDVDTIQEIIRKILLNRMSFVIDFFHPSITDDEVQTVTELVTTLLLQENKLYGLRHIFYEESAEFIHQQGRKTKASVSIERLVRMAGNCQVGSTFINQRAEQISKAVFELCDTVILHRQTGANSIKTTKRWLDNAGVNNHLDVTKSLSQLGNGECWILDKGKDAVRSQVPQKQSFHPNREYFDFENSVLPNTDDVNNLIAEIAMMTDTEEARYVLPSWTEGENADVLVAPVVETQTVIDYEFVGLTGNQKRLVDLAKRTAYGNATVKQNIDKLYNRGYVNYAPVGIDLAYISDNNGNVYTLSSQIECTYAQLLINYKKENN